MALPHVKFKKFPVFSLSCVSADVVTVFSVLFDHTYILSKFVAFDTVKIENAKKMLNI